MLAKLLGARQVEGPRPNTKIMSPHLPPENGDGIRDGTRGIFCIPNEATTELEQR